MVLSTNALHSGCAMQVAMQSSSVCEPPISLKIGALDSRFDLLQRSAVSSTSNWACSPVVVIVVVIVVVSVVDSGCSKGSPVNASITRIPVAAVWAIRLDHCVSVAGVM